MKRLLFHFFLAAFIFLVAGCDRSGPPATASVTPARTKGDIFTTPTVLRIDIEIPRSGMSALRHTQWGNGRERPVVKATVTENGVVYSSVALHLKGAAGSFRPVDDRPAMTLNFDKFVAHQSFHGLHKISLNNSVQDRSCLSEKICRELFDAAGVPVPRAGHALVKLNGRDLGLYVLLEGANQQFLKRYFSNTKGNLFDGGFVGDVNESLAVNCGQDPNNRSGLTALLAAEAETRRARNLAPLEKALDVDRFLSMIAMEVIICHWDGYAVNRNNWRIFHDLDSRRMVFIPHGVDQTFGGGGMGQTFQTPFIQTHGRIAGAVLGTAEGRRRYRERFGQLYTNVFKVDEICSRIDQIEAVLGPALAETDPSSARSQEHQADFFKQRIRRRSEDLRRQLGVPVARLKFPSNNVVPLTGWRPSAVRSGSPIFDQDKDSQGQPMLMIRTGNTLTSGSWRTRAVLGPGEYRLEGRLRGNGVTLNPADPLGGAGLRISKGPPARKLSGTFEWTDFAYQFQVEEEAADVEFICELRALRGEACFDPASLRLVRIR